MYQILGDNSIDFVGSAKFNCTIYLIYVSTCSCLLCVAESKARSYEKQLFLEYEHSNWIEGSSHASGGGSRRPGIMEKIMRILLSFTGRQASENFSVEH